MTSTDRFDGRFLRHRLDRLTSTHTDIEDIRKYCLAFIEAHADFTATLRDAFVHAHSSKTRLAIFYAFNDIFQHTAIRLQNKHGQPRQLMAVLESCCSTFCLGITESLRREHKDFKDKYLRVLDIWKDRNTISSRFINDLRHKWSQQPATATAAVSAYTASDGRAGKQHQQVKRKAQPMASSSGARGDGRPPSTSPVLPDSEEEEEDPTEEEEEESEEEERNPELKRRRLLGPHHLLPSLTKTLTNAKATRSAEQSRLVFLRTAGIVIGDWVEDPSVPATLENLSRRCEDAYQQELADLGTLLLSMATEFKHNAAQIEKLVALGDSGSKESGGGEDLVLVG